MIGNIAYRVVVADAPVGWFVWLETDSDVAEHEMFFDCREWAQAYARGLSWGAAVQVNDRSTDLPAIDVDYVDEPCQASGQDPSLALAQVVDMAAWKRGREADARYRAAEGRAPTRRPTLSELMGWPPLPHDDGSAA